MKKKLVLLFILAILPICTFAKTYYADYNYKNFKDTLIEEGIELQNKNYKENSKQAIIYLFRGKGCGFCHRLLEYLNSISTEYGDKFKVVSFEVWQDEKNKTLFNKVANVTGVSNNGVPYYIIGEKVFTGYAEEFNEGIIEAINNEYNKKGEDVFEKLAKSEKPVTSGGDTVTILFGVFVIVALGTFTCCMISANNTKKVLSEIEKIRVKEEKNKEEKVKEVKNNEVKEKKVKEKNEAKKAKKEE